MELSGKLMKNSIFFLSALLILACMLFIIQPVWADTITDQALHFLESKQDVSGRINTGFSAPSQWSAIAFASNGMDISTIKNPSVSLRDFLEGNIPSEPSSATDWETRILAIVATDGNPANYGGVNYITHLENFYNNNQMGDVCSLNDDIFGLLAEVAAGTGSDIQIKQTVLNFLISKQDPLDGGFGYSAPGCAYYATSADMTGAAVQALIAAKNNNVTNPNLDDAIVRAKNYLLVNQNSDGGFGYYGSSDTDTSGWVLMTFNVLGLADSTPSAKLKGWLISQQSKDDGGFLAFDYGSNSFLSNATTTAQAIIGLSGKSWILKIFDPSTLVPTTTPVATPAALLTSTPTITPTPITTQIILAGNSPTQTPTPTNTPTPTVTPTINPAEVVMIRPTSSPTPTTGQVLGIQSKEVKPTYQQPDKHIPLLPVIFLGLGVISLIIYKKIEL